MTLFFKAPPECSRDIYAPFYTPVGRIMGTCVAGGVQSICPLNNFNSFHCIIIKLCENVCWHNLLAKFNNQSDPMKDFGVMALVVAKINIVCTVTSIFFNGSSSISLVNYYTGVFCDIWTLLFEILMNPYLHV